MVQNGKNAANLLFLHTFEYDFLLKTMKADMSKAVELAIPFVISTIYSASQQRQLWKIYPLNLSVGTGTQGYYPQFKRGVLSGHKNQSWRQQHASSHRRVRQKRRLQLLDC